MAYVELNRCHICFVRYHTLIKFGSKSVGMGINFTGMGINYTHVSVLRVISIVCNRYIATWSVVGNHIWAASQLMEKIKQEVNEAKRIIKSVIWLTLKDIRYYFLNEYTNADNTLGLNTKIKSQAGVRNM